MLRVYNNTMQNIIIWLSICKSPIIEMKTLSILIIKRTSRAFSQIWFIQHRSYDHAKIQHVHMLMLQTSLTCITSTDSDVFESSSLTPSGSSSRCTHEAHVLLQGQIKSGSARSLEITANIENNENICKLNPPGILPSRLKWLGYLSIRKIIATILKK